MTATETARFETGKTYTCRSSCNHECVWSFVVVARTADTVTIREADEPDFSCGVNVLGGEEVCFPLGQYSEDVVLRSGHAMSPA